MDVQHAYNQWASQYDSNDNKTRDLEAIALRETLGAIPFDTCLEIGCGTGKNTEWLLTKASTILAIDLSEEMLAAANTKIHSAKVHFQQADIKQPWHFITKPFDLVTFSLVLEHIEDLDAVFNKASSALQKGGYLYIGELHPFKQYTGTKARFETEQGVQVVPCYNHQISDFIHAAKKNGLKMVDVNEYFDTNDRNNLPRILTVLFQKV